ncbi:DUF305 domain-containing protein [Antribacter sp. KLBMP9083]|uniref:DUF305 domain-containing protein n=1 Tax=Antribacter soli TaxID=2910976 RepID=A0AA41U8Y5_9MICO|nr:DUF305 domain-containing protein [Antribacter soli]MCF4120977.1 DUF305 domain-containing protein [Antribacter soli]
MTLTLRRTLRATTAAIALAVALAACSGTEDPAGGDAEAGTTAAGSEHNDADTGFAQMMIIHHEGAVEMAGLAAEKSSTPEIKDLAERIAGAQQPEIDLMTGWLTSWGEDLEGMDHSGMDMGGMDMDGMDQAEAMAMLGGLSGAEFDEHFLHLMTAHHQGAIEMSQAEIEDGVNEEATTLAQTIIDAQTQEINEMAELAGSPVG